MVKPASARSRPSFGLNFKPAPEALREPMIATIGSDKARISPQMSGGASSIIYRRGG
jgi:hypothetical protein